MPYLSSLERRGLEEGLKQGLERGREEGRKEGRKEGREEGREEGLRAARELVAVALEAKFGLPGRKLMPQVRRIRDVAGLRGLAKIIKVATTVEEVRRHLS